MTILSGIFSETPINKTIIPQKFLDIDDKERSNFLPWKGQFSPQLIESLLNYFSKKDSVIFDPFLGSGTVLHEAGRLGLPAFGTEINPAAIILARVYLFVNIPKDQREIYTHNFLKHLERELPIHAPLFQNEQNISPMDETELQKKIIGLVSGTKQKLLIILYKALVVLLDFYRYKLTSARIIGVAKTINHIVKKLPYSEQPICALHADARNTSLQASSVNLVITSPPYINVFNYHQQYRASVEALDWNLLEVAKSELGSNRKYRGNRFFTVVQYCLDVALTFQELLRVCAPDSQMIFVVGRESNVRKMPFFNGELVAEVVHQSCGANLALRQERKFINRYGQTIKEDILHFVKSRAITATNNLEAARNIAIKALEIVYQHAGEEVRADIARAIEQAHVVKPSPIYNGRHSHNLVMERDVREAVDV